MRRVHPTIFCGKALSIIHSECVFVALGCQPCNAHAPPYCHLWPVRFYNIFLRYLVNGTIFEKNKLLEIKCVFWIPLQLLSLTFVILRRTERDMIKNVYRSSWKVSTILVRFEWRFNFSAVFSRKILKYKLSWKSVQWKPSCSMQRDRHVEANSRFS